MINALYKLNDIIKCLWIAYLMRKAIFFDSNFVKSNNDIEFAIYSYYLKFK